jgi:hypothetical protein
MYIKPCDGAHDCHNARVEQDNAYLCSFFKKYGMDHTSPLL